MLRHYNVSYRSKLIGGYMAIHIGSNKVTSCFAAMVLGMVMAAGTTGVALAAEQFPAEGGSWQYGDNGFRAYSNYWHASKTHGSSVSAGNKTSTSICTARNKWSYAQVNMPGTSAPAYHYRLC